MYTTNAGLPSSFVILYNENLATAKSRQSKCYNIPLRLWVPPKMYGNIQIPKPGLILRRSGSPPLPYVPTTINKPSQLPIKQVASSHLPELDIKERVFFRTSSLSSKMATDQPDDSNRSSKKKQPTFTTKHVKLAVNIEETTDWHAKTENVHQERTKMLSIFSRLSSRKSDKGPDSESQEEQRNSLKSSNDSSKILQLIQDSKFGERNPDQQDSFEILKDEEQVLFINNSSKGKKPSPGESRKIENKNDNCSVEFLSMVPEYARVLITPIMIPPIPPRVTTVALLAEPPAEESEGEEASDETTNNANDCIDA